jgi:CHAD domain-containing protein
MQLAAKPLSAPRDALVTKQAVEKLPHAKHRDLARIRSALKTYSMTEERQYEKSGASSVTGYILGRLLKATCRLKWGHFEWQDIIPCLSKSYARGRRAYLKSLRHPTSTNFHEWRKRVKNLEDQLEFLSPNWPPRTREMITGLKTLGDQLGDGHDLVLLKEFATKQCVHCKETENLFRLIDSRRQEFEGLALKSGVRIFGDRPKKACERFEEDWKEWRHNK